MRKQLSNRAVFDFKSRHGPYSLVEESKVAAAALRINQINAVYLLKDLGDVFDLASSPWGSHVL